jgi:hypothetical protein
MEYRGKRISIVDGGEPNSYKWTVRLDEKTVKSGTAISRESALTSAVWLIDRARALADSVPPVDRPKADS